MSPSKRTKINVALAGQPNCGKSTMFNAITGSSARVGNYPGITVDHMEGFYKNENYEIKFTDLPGTYSLTSYSLEEIVTRNFILDENPDIVLCMIDAAALERSLYLVIQLLEMGTPLVLGLNMMDEVRKIGTKINIKKLSNIIGIPVVECIARKGIGKNEIINEIIKLYSKGNEGKHCLDISYGSDLNPAIKEMVKIIEKNNFLDNYPSKWLAVKYMEEDENIIEQGKRIGKCHEELIGIVKKTEKHTELTLNTYPEAIVADYRYGFIQSLLKQNIISRDQILRHSVTETIDKFLTHRIFGPLIMFAVLYILFTVTFNLGAYPQDWIQNFFGWIGELGEHYIRNEMLKSLIVSGIIDGVGAVLSFAPLILIMFAMLCFLEDLGYMARLAYMLDRVFKFFGLHGSSVMPFIIAGGIPGGCAVPGVMTARTLRSPKERIATVLTAPFMVCGAKTTVYLMLCKTFFPKSATAVMLIITIASWILALIVAKILRMTIIKGAPTPFIMELPPYRLPTFYGIVTHTFDRIWQFIKKAGTIIFAISIVIWALITFPQLPEGQIKKFEKEKQQLVSQIENNEKLSALEKEEMISAVNDDIDRIEKGEALKYSLGGRIGRKLEILSEYCGFNWQTNIALVGGFAAKEVILSTLSTAYSLSSFDDNKTIYTSATGKSLLKYKKTRSNDLSTMLKKDSNWSLPAIISLFLFILLYAPCMATIPAIAKETSWGYAIFGTLGSLIGTYILCVAVYQIGILFI